MPVKMPTAAGQFSCCTPIGWKIGTMVWPILARTDLSVSPLPKDPSVPQLFKNCRQATITTITLPARRMKPFRRSHVRSRTPFTVGMWYGGISITKALVSPVRTNFFSTKPVNTAARMPMR